ncbi:MAG TPA: DNA polymerase III subunit epsilon, partial [Pseudomonas sp.]|nr:DNA polymerase III subunit epsilon [Pseudomonas sp.]
VATRIIRASNDELAAHAARLAAIEKAAGAASLWAQLEQPMEAETQPA